MNTQSDAMAPLEVNVTVPVVIPASRRLYWSVRRELWENRSLLPCAPRRRGAVSGRRS